ncbi:hypothetical protein EBZ80_03565 [bacterium]|nr:hypothetical protein [bacterium]
MAKKKNAFARPEVWGSPAWVFLHCVAGTFPERPTAADRANYLRFFSCLQDVLPCRLCRKHYGAFLRRFPPDIEDRRSLKEWAVRIHDYVNARLKKRVIRDCDTADELILQSSQQQQLLRF